ncbi:hypothetical protein LRS06_19630 [Hymenobacter sp. J193]|uniref:helix-turn-helix domain-containing protein n=1 Tax=Hymenobacter sp. J193 TaxID=2898429 RepID=UPI002151FE13|nr:hypothetical protein [Hymenobacter sp. J193]MCR5889943.1 hypothetical protein [Hymenobacter sp. J193]
MSNMAESVAERFALLVKDLGISKNAFAKSLGRTATVIQHLIEGRNKPGFDLLETLFTVYPNVSKDWMLLGKGPRYVAQAGQLFPPVNAPSVDEEAEDEEAPAPEEEEAAQDLPAAEAPQAAAANAKPPVLAAAPASESLPSIAAAVAEPAPAVAPAPVAAPAAVAPQAPAEGWQAALYTQQMAHQLALAELRNQHLQEQQRLMQQMMDLMQRQISR